MSSLVLSPPTIVVSLLSFWLFFFYSWIVQPHSFSLDCKSQYLFSPLPQPSLCCFLPLIHSKMSLLVYVYANKYSLFVLLSRFHWYVNSYLLNIFKYIHLYFEILNLDNARVSILITCIVVEHISREKSSKKLKKFILLVVYIKLSSKKTNNLYSHQ